MNAAPNPLNRRHFLQSAAAAGILATLHGSAEDIRALPPSSASGANRARNLIFMVADGMSMGALTLADLHCRRSGRRSHWAARMEAGGMNVGLMDTASANSHVTDSAAGCSAWSCGHRVPNGSLNVTADSVAREPLLVTARRAGKAIGLVTSTRLTHATPAGFLATVDSRASEDAIALQYLERGLDVGLGGGRKHFVKDVRADHRDLVAEFTAAGHTVVNDRAALLAAPEGAERLLGLFDTDHLPYRLDHRGEAELGARIPSLAEMTTAALSRLARRRDGFVLQVEGGRVDHAAHNNDSASIILEMLDFDEAVAIALSFQQQNPDTLVVVTTDHGNSNPGLTGVGQNDTALARLDGFRVSTERLAAGLGSTASLEELRKRLVAATGLPLTDDELAPLHAALAGHGNAPYRPDRAFAPTLASVLENHTAIGWTGVDHTADFVLFSAIGPGAAGFPTLIRNDAVHSHLVEALSLHSVRAGA